MGTMLTSNELRLSPLFVHLLEKPNDSYIKICLSNKKKFPIKFPLFSLRVYSFLTKPSSLQLLNFKMCQRKKPTLDSTS